MISTYETTINKLVGLSTDEKPKGAPVGSVFYETDTGVTYLFTGKYWQTEKPAYTLPTASADTLGGVKVGDGLAIASGVLSVDPAANVAAAAGDAPTAAEFKALLDALIAAGFMEAAS